MFIILFRVLIIYVIVLVYLRIMGKRQVGEMQPFELVITLMMADIATLPMTQTSMPLLFSLIPLTMLVLVHFVVSFLSRKSITMRKIINGRPVVVISPKGVELKALQELNMTFDDLMQGLRSLGVYKLEDVSYVLVETNGTLSVIQKTEVLPASNKDLKIKTQPASLPLILISCSKMIEKNIKIAEIDEKFLQNIYEKIKVKSYKDILILTLNAFGDVYVQPKNGIAQTLKTNYNGVGKWWKKFGLCLLFLWF